MTLAITGWAGTNKFAPELKMSNETILILLVEDEDPHAELIQRAFEDQGAEFQIYRVKSLSEAREYMRTHQPRLIIADWRWW